MEDDQNSKTPPPSDDLSGSGAIKLNENISIDLTRPIPFLDKSGAKAYEANGKSGVPDSLFSLVCENHLTPRTLKVPSYSAIDNPKMLNLVSSGSIYIPSEKKGAYCLVYEKNVGQPINNTEVCENSRLLKSDNLMNEFIIPMTRILGELRNKDLVHGEIWPGNIFTGTDGSIQDFVLGDCLCSPVSYNMPVEYLTTPRAMADPAARGQGTHEDDIYAFGATLAALLKSCSPMGEMSKDEILKSKIKNGSYAALIGKAQLKGSVLELLRGVLHDNVGERWKLEEIQSWIDGRRLSPKQTTRRIKAQRPLEFLDEKYLYPEILANDFFKDTNQAAELINSGEFDQWMERSISDANMRKLIGRAKELARLDSKQPSDCLVTRVSIAMDPLAPIRYKNLKIMVDGFGEALASAISVKDNLSPYIEFLTNMFVSQWIEMQPVSRVNDSSIASTFVECKNHVLHKGMGFGIERCLYEMNKSTHCLSDNLAGYYIRTEEELMHALEKVSTLPDRPYTMFDAHIVAFLSVRKGACINKYLFEINSKEPGYKVMGELHTLAEIQRLSQLGRFPGITGWIAENLVSAYNLLHDKKRREEIQNQINKVKETGNLVELASLVGNNDIFRADSEAFQRAKEEYRLLSEEGRILEHKLKNNKNYGRAIGRTVSAIVSGIVAAIVILATALMAVLNGGIGIF